MAQVNYFYNKVRFKLKKPRSITHWIKKAAEQENAQIVELNYIFCSDSFLLGLNKQFLNHNTLTDIITFDNSENQSNLIGEIYISVERVKENSKKFKVSFEHELARVMIHGVLHLLGYKDKKTSEKALMRKKEEAYLSLRK